MRLRAVLFPMLLLLLSPHASLAAGADEFLYGKLGDHFYRRSDHGYFKIFGAGDEAAIVLRAAPSLDSKVIKQLREGEIVASDGVSHWGGPTSWQRISAGSDVGWISQRNLLRATPRFLGKSIVPKAGSCSGHTPAWIASWTNRLVRISLFPGRTEMDISLILSSEEQRASLLTASTGEMSIDLILTTNACALVQGQILNGRTGVMIVTDPTGKRLLTGCCEAAADSFAD